MGRPVPWWESCLTNRGRAPGCSGILSHTCLQTFQKSQSGLIVILSSVELYTIELLEQQVGAILPQS